MSTPPRDYSDIANDVVEAYKRLHNVQLVCEVFHISTKTVSMLCRQAGVDLQYRGKKGSKIGRKKRSSIPDQKDKPCAYCRAYSRTGDLHGWCMTHRRSVRADYIESCYK